MGEEKRQKVVVTGNQGYIGSVLTPTLLDRGYYVVGIDAGIFRENVMGSRKSPSKQIIKDVRDIEADDVAGSVAIVHLAGLSNDPLGELDAGLTLDINYKASVRLAEIAKKAGVGRFLFSSSCSIYGVSGGETVDEASKIDPRTVYAESKILVENDLRRMVDNSFAPVFLRNATVFGYSPRMRLDLVVNNLSASGYLRGEIEVLSDGTPWRPNLHVKDCAGAFAHLMEQADDIGGQSYNIGLDVNNLRVKDIAEKVGDQIKGAKVLIKGTSSPDERTYRVNFEKIAATGWRGSYVVEDGVRDIVENFKAWGLTEEEFTGGRYNTLHRYKEMLDEGKMDSKLRVRR